MLASCAASLRPTQLDNARIANTPGCSVIGDNGRFLLPKPDDMASLVRNLFQFALNGLLVSRSLTAARKLEDCLSANNIYDAVSRDGNLRLFVWADFPPQHERASATTARYSGLNVRFVRRAQARGQVFAELTLSRVAATNPPSLDDVVRALGDDFKTVTPPGRGRAGETIQYVKIHDRYRTTIRVVFDDAGLLKQMFLNQEGFPGY